MVEGKRDEDWWHTASLLAMQANVHRRQNVPPLSPARFHPFLHREEEDPIELVRRFQEQQRRA